MRKSLKLLAVSAVLAFCGLHSLSAEPLDFKNSVGIYGLMQTQVMGIQYQRWCTERLGFQTTGYIFYEKAKWEGDNSEFNASLSGELQLKLFETPFGKRSGSILYAWFLGGYHGFTKQQWVDAVGTYEDATYQPGYWQDGKYYSNAILGLGFGFDIMFLNHISIPIQFGFAGEFPNDMNAGFCVGAGVRYRF